MVSFCLFSLPLLFYHTFFQPHLLLLSTGHETFKGLHPGSNLKSHSMLALLSFDFLQSIILRFDGFCGFSAFNSSISSLYPDPIFILISLLLLFYYSFTVFSWIGSPILP